MTTHGWQADIQQLSTALKQDERWAAVETQYRDADVIVLGFPLYVDSLPAETTLALERLAAVRRTRTPQRMLAIANCGFPEAQQNDVALAICRQFARETGLHWCGGLAIGGGGAINGHALRHLGKMTEHITGALDLVIAGLQTDGEVPAAAFELVRRRAMPPWLYVAMANLGMLAGAMQHHKLLRINAQPYR